MINLPRGVLAAVILIVLPSSSTMTTWASEEPFAFSKGNFSGSASGQQTDRSPVSGDGLMPMAGPTPQAGATAESDAGQAVFPQVGVTLPFIANLGAGDSELVDQTSAHAFAGESFAAPGLSEIGRPHLPGTSAITGMANFEGGSFEKPPAKTEKPAQKEAAADPGAKGDEGGFGVNQFEERPADNKPDNRATTKPPAGEQRKPDEAATRKPPKNKPERVDARTRPGGKDEFGGGGEFGKPDGKPNETRRQVRQQQPERQSRRPVQHQQRRANAPQIDPGITAFELRSFGVQPIQRLRQGRMHGPTPTSVPGGNVITTQNLVNAMVNREKFILIDILGSEYTIPQSWSYRAMGAGGDFGDRVQSQVNRWLAKVTNQNTNYPIVVFCSDPMCWMSYNAALRARAAGYQNIYWYRGGLRAWQMAGLKLVAADQ